VIDVEQLAVDSIDCLFERHLLNVEFEVRSLEQIVGLLSGVVRRYAANLRRYHGRLKRSTSSCGTQRFMIDESIDNGRSIDAATMAESADEIDFFLGCLHDCNQKTVFLLLVMGYSWNEIAIHLGIDLQRVRRLVDQTRRILQPIALTRD
jgi:DNA-directed RNA polymerase specialized sigma24 family protein